MLPSWPSSGPGRTRPHMCLTGDPSLPARPPPSESRLIVGPSSRTHGHRPKRLKRPHSKRRSRVSESRTRACISREVRLRRARSPGTTSLAQDSTHTSRHPSILSCALVCLSPPGRPSSPTLTSGQPWSKRSNTRLDGRPLPPSHQRALDSPILNLWLVPRMDTFPPPLPRQPALSSNLYTFRVCRLTLIWSLSCVSPWVRDPQTFASTLFLLACVRVRGTDVGSRRRAGEGAVVGFDLGDQTAVKQTVPALWSWLRVPGRLRSLALNALPPLPSLARLPPRPLSLPTESFTVTSPLTGSSTMSSGQSGSFQPGECFCVCLE